jgi:hypothetical protein
VAGELSKHGQEALLTAVAHRNGNVAQKPFVFGAFDWGTAK